MLPGLVSAFRALPAYRALRNVLPGRNEGRVLGTLPGSSGAVLAVALAEDAPQRLLVIVAPSTARAEEWHADLAVLLEAGARFYPQREALGEEEPHFEIAGERIETLDALIAGRTRVIVTTLRATAERTRVPRTLARARMELATGDTDRPQEVIARLERMGYARAPTVTDVAQFAVRGGLIDVYGFGMADPARIEWWGDEILSVRTFDLDTQRSDQEVGLITILPVGIARPAGDEAEVEAQSLLELLPVDTLLLVDAGIDPGEVDRVWQEATHHLEVARRLGEDVPGRESIFLDPREWRQRWDGFARLDLNGDPGDGHDLRMRPPAGGQPRHADPAAGGSRGSDADSLRQRGPARAARRDSRWR